MTTIASNFEVTKRLNELGIPFDLRECPQFIEHFFVRQECLCVNKSGTGDIAAEFLKSPEPPKALFCESLTEPQDLRD